MTGTFVKLYGSILNSSVWCADTETKLVWITMLLLADADGYVSGAVPGIARQAGVSVEACRRSLDFLSSPDTDSRTLDEEGRRILVVPGGWRLVNSRKYREMRTENQVKAAERMKRHRDRKAREVGSVTRNVTGRDERNERDTSRMSRAEVEVEGEEEKRTAAADASKPPAGETPEPPPTVEAPLLPPRAREGLRELRCPQCDKPSLVREKGRVTDTPTAGRGWFCDTRRSGGICGAIYGRDDPRVIAQLSVGATDALERERQLERKGRELHLKAAETRARDERPPEFKTAVELVRTLRAQAGQHARNGLAGDSWARVLAEIEGRLNRHSFATWFRPTAAVGILTDADGDRLVVEVPTPQFRDWLLKNYATNVAAAFKAGGLQDLGGPLYVTTEELAAADEPGAMGGAA